MYINVYCSIHIYNLFSQYDLWVFFVVVVFLFLLLRQALAVLLWMALSTVLPLLPNQRCNRVCHHVSLPSLIQRLLSLAQCQACAKAVFGKQLGSGPGPVLSSS